MLQNYAIKNKKEEDLTAVLQRKAGTKRGKNSVARLLLFFTVQNAEFPDKFFAVSKGQTKVKGA